MEHTIGLREMRANASDIIRRVEGGEMFVVTVQGREVAELSPRQPRRWRTWDQVAAVLARPVDGALASDLARIDATVESPWERGS